MDKRWNTALWICQILLSLGFLAGAYLKLTLPIGELAEMWPWAGENSLLVKITGGLDLLTGIGLVLPALLRLLPKLTVLAAWGAILMMLGAIAFHISRGEGSDIGINVLYLLMAALTAWGRSKKAPIADKKSQGGV